MVIKINDRIVAGTGRDGKDAMGYDLFDVVQKDRELTYNNTFGYARLGTAVYATSVPNVRYGYPEFYNMCLDEYTNGSSTYIENYHVVRSLVNNNGVLSGFDVDNFAQIPDIFYPSSNKWEFGVKFKLNSVGTLQAILGSKQGGGMTLYISTAGTYQIYLSSNGNSWNIAEDVRGSYVFSANTWYWTKAEFTGSAYNFYYSTDGVSYTLDKTISSAAILAPANQHLGVSDVHSSPLLGNIDMTEAYWKINGVLWWKGRIPCVKSSNGHTYYDIANKPMVDSMTNNGKHTWLYGIDTSDRCIMLPTKSHGAIIEKSKPDTYLWYRVYEDGWCEQGGLFGGSHSSWTARSTMFPRAFKDTNYYVGVHTGHTSNTDEPCINAKYPSYFTCVPYNSTGNANWHACGYTTIENVPPKFDYMVVGNKKVASAIGEYTEVTTATNDTLPLFYAHYDTIDFNHVSWLKSMGQENSGTIYSNIYAILQSALTGTNPYNLDVINVNDMEAGTDYSAYWKVNTSTVKFTAPIRTNKRVLVAKKDPSSSDSRWYRLHSDGWLEQGGIVTGDAKDWDATATFLKPYKDTLYCASCQAGRNDGSGSGINNQAFIHTKATDKMVADLYGDGTSAFMMWFTQGYTNVPTVADYTEPMTLHFKIANAVSNIDMIDIGAITDALADKVDTTELTEVNVVIDSYVNGSSGYRIWSDGYCEQWGSTSCGEVTTATTTFLKKYKDTSYNLLAVQTNQSTASDTEVGIQYTPSSASYAVISTHYINPNTTTVSWRTFGYLAEGEY